MIGPSVPTVAVSNTACHKSQGSLQSAAPLSLDNPVLHGQARNVAKIGHIVGYKNRAAADGMRGNHPIVVPSPCPTALSYDLTIGLGGRSIERQNRDAAQKNLQPDLPYAREGRISVETSLQLREAQGREQHLAVMLGQLVENGIRAVTGVDGDIGVDEVGHDRTKPSIPLTHGDLDRLSLFNGRRLGHAA